ncbi:MAG: glycine zipper family protein [Betaproteobacteria bacterium]
MRAGIMLLLAAGAVSGCATVPPSGPSVTVLPGSTKSFEQFRADDSECRQYAATQAGMSAEQASSESGVKSAAIGTAVGAAAGALMGGRDGAAVGAGAGLIIGSTSGAGAAGHSARTLQQRYDMGYLQCMYAKGHRVPVSGRYENSRRTTPTAVPPPPPPGSPPPPPPR